MAVITAADSASWLRNPALEDDPSLVQVVELVNALVDEEWTTPVDPVPVRITLLALGVAARAWSHDPSTAHLESVTRGVDDATRTERYRASTVDASIYLTAGELAILNGEPVTRSLRLTIYGES